MLMITLKNRLRRWNILPLNFSKKEHVAIRIMSCIFLLEMIISLFFIRIWFFSDTSSYALATMAHTKPGIATEQFMSELKSVGIKSVLSQKINRDPFSVKGVLIGLNKDSIEVFEYPDHDTALKEASILAQKYVGSKAKNIWKDTTHLYVKDRIVIFYMGTEKSILATLSENEGFSRASPQVAISKP